MSKIDEIRASSPEYDKYTDAQIARALYQTRYKDFPWENFVKVIGLQDQPANEGPSSRTSPRNFTQKQEIRAAKREAEELRSAQQGTLGALDLALAGASKAIVRPVVGGGAGLLARATGGDPNVARQQAQERHTYEPRTEVGRYASEAIGDAALKALSPVGNAINAADTVAGKVSPGLQQVLRQVAGTGADIADVLPAAGVVSSALRHSVQAARASAAARASRPATTLAEKARAGGLKLRPSDIANRLHSGETPSAPAVVGEWLGDPQAIREQFIKDNKVPLNNILAQDVGIPEGSPFTRSAFEKAEAPHHAVYNDLRAKIPQVPLGDDLLQGITEVGRPSESVLSLSGVSEKLKQDLSRESMSGGQLIDTISDLRRQGFKAAASENPDIADMGAVRLALAAKLETQLDRAVAQYVPSMAGQYQEARRGLAKLHALEEATAAGEVDPQALLRMRNKAGENTFSGGMAYVADMAEAFPRVLQLNVPERGAIEPSGFLRNLYHGVGTPVRAILRRTRGEASEPQTGLGKALSEYYLRKGDQDMIPAGPIGPSRQLEPPPIYGQAPEPPSPPSPKQLPSPETVTPPEIPFMLDSRGTPDWASRNHPGAPRETPQLSLADEPGVAPSLVGGGRGVEPDRLLIDALTRGHKARVLGRTFETPQRRAPLLLEVEPGVAEAKPRAYSIPSLEDQDLLIRYLRGE